MKCTNCNGTGYTTDIENNEWCCLTCYGYGDTERATGIITASDGTKLYPIDREGRLIRAAGDVMRAQRLKGIAKYQSTLEDQHGYNLVGMIDMAAEELADGAVYVQKLREMHLALLDELEKAVDTISPRVGVQNVRKIINRERGNV